MTKKIRLLIVDDSVLARKLIARSLEPFRDIEVVGAAADPYGARDLIMELNPDVVTLDIEMPRMDGLTFLKLIMKNRPMPVIIMSSLTAAGSTKALEALRAGAVDIMDKPAGSHSASVDGTRLAEKIRAASVARCRRASDSDEPPQPAVQSRGRTYPARKVILIGASTGGTEALKAILTRLPADLPGICVVQHIPACFSKAFADRLDLICQLDVKEAEHGDAVEPGHVLIAPGGYHMLLKWTGGRYAVDLNEGPPVHYQRPAVDILFDSAVKAGAAPHALAILLTGMGADGAAGMLRLRQDGATTAAQDEESCVVYGMPREAVRIGAAQQSVSLRQMSHHIDNHFNGVAAQRAARAAQLRCANQP
jgi:two-component system, chemotaxis family, protein-glutamate methylesterase/glutaminase